MQQATLLSTEEGSRGDMDLQGCSCLPAQFLQRRADGCPEILPVLESLPHALCIFPAAIRDGGSPSRIRLPRCLL